MSINNLFNPPARPCSRVTGNRIKPSFTFVKNWETVVSPLAQVTNGKEKVTSGVLISPRSHISHNSSFSSIAENSPTPIIISHTTSAHSIVEDDGDDNEVVDNEHEADDNNRADDEGDDNVVEDDDGGTADDEEEVHSHRSASGTAENLEGGGEKIMEISSGGQAESFESSDRDVHASHLMPPPPAPPKDNNTDELPDVSPIPAAVGVVAYKTPTSAGIKRPRNMMTSTPAQKETPKETPEFEVVDTAKRLKQAANTFIPARKRPAFSNPVSTREKQPGSQASDSEQSVMPEVQLWVGAGPLRKVSDATELDVLLTAMEDISYQFKQKNPNPMKKKTVNGFVLKVRKEITDVIDSVQELKSAQSALTRTTHALKVSHQDLVQKQNTYFNLLDQEASLEREKKAVEKQAAMRDVSEWLFQLEDLQTRYRKTRADKQVEENYNTKENLPALLKETITSLTAAKQLKNANDKVERLIETRLNSSRHGRHLRDILK